MYIVAFRKYKKCITLFQYPKIYGNVTFTIPIAGDMLKNVMFIQSISTVRDKTVTE